MDIEERKIHHWKRYRKLEKKAKSNKGVSEKEAGDIIAYRRLHGGGFFDSIKNKVSSFFSTRKDFSNADRKTFEANKDKRIVKMMVVRTPLSWFSQTFADIASFGTFSQQAKKLGYDKVYHLYSLIYLEGIEQPILYEKNETVVLRFGSPSTGKDTQMKEVGGIPSDMTLGKFVNTAQQIMGSEEYWHYTFDKQNCQRFLMLNLKANNLLTPELEKFILQDASQLLAKAPIASKFAQGLSDTSAFLRKLTGKGLEKKSGGAKGGVLPLDQVAERFPQMMRLLRKLLGNQINTLDADFEPNLFELIQGYMNTYHQNGQLPTDAQLRRRVNSIVAMSLTVNTNPNTIDDIEEEIVRLIKQNFFNS